MIFLACDLVWFYVAIFRSVLRSVPSGLIVIFLSFCCCYVFRGSAALSGFAGAAVYPYCQRKFGLWRTGQWAIAQQLVFVTIAATPLFIYGHQQGATVAAFVLSIAVVS